MTVAFQRMFGILKRWNDNQVTPSLTKPHELRYRFNIYGKKINIITDHQPLVWFKAAELNIRVQNWRFKLSEFNYAVIYKPGKLNLKGGGGSIKTFILKFFQTIA